MHYSDSPLRAVRNHFGLTQLELAVYLGIDRSLLTHVEADRRPLPTAATWLLLPLLTLLPPPMGGGSPEILPPDPAETTPQTLDALQWRLQVCRYEAASLVYHLGRQLPRLHAARHRRTLPALLAALPAPPPGTPASFPVPSRQWAEQRAEGAAADLARFGVQARALQEARLAGLVAEAAFLEAALGGASAPPVSGAGAVDALK